ncbi:hypothetical protein Hanom_Chr15g01411201 [Helianthus anomalus]
MKLRPSPAKDPKKDDPLKSQGVIKNPSSERCHFTDPEIDRIRHCFPTDAVFKPFDASMKSDCISDTWVAFPTTPFLIGFSYPFPAFTQSFFALTGMCYIHRHVLYKRGSAYLCYIRILDPRRYWILDAERILEPGRIPEAERIHEPWRILGAWRILEPKSILGPEAFSNILLS